MSEVPSETAREMSLRRPYGTPEVFVEPAFPTLKRGANKRCAYGAAVLAAIAALTTSAFAAERVTLRNGFEIRCDHHAEVEGRVRLYLSAGEDSYIDFPPEEIDKVETLPDPPPPAGNYCRRRQRHLLKLPRTESSPPQTWARCSTRPATSTTWTWTCWPAWSRPRATAMPAPSAAPALRG